MIAESNFLHEYVLAGATSVLSFYRLYINPAYPPCPPSGGEEAVLVSQNRRYLYKINPCFKLMIQPSTHI